MAFFHDDPTLEDLLGDALTQAIMRADGVDPRKLEAMLRSMAREPAVAAMAEPDRNPAGRPFRPIACGAR